jgi:fibronectin-binding autotransporter adhesin
MRMRTSYLVGTVLLSLSVSVRAASLTWDVTAGDAGVVTDGSGNWSEGGGSWNAGSGDATWSNATPDSATIGGGTLGAAGTITLTTNIVAGGLTFNTPNGGGSYTVTGSALTLGGAGVTVNASASLGLNMTLGATQLWTVASGQTLSTSTLLSFGGNALTIGGAGNVTCNSWGYSSGQNGTLTKTGTGTLTTTLNLRLGGDPDTGYVNVQGGVLSVQAAQLFDGSAYSSGGAITISGGGVLELQNWNYGATYNLGQLRASANAIVLNNGTIRMTGTDSYHRGFTIAGGGATLEAAGGANWALPNDSPIVVNGSPNLTLAGAGVGTFGKVFYGGGTLTKSGSGTWTLINTCTGNTVIASGTLVIGNGVASGAVVGAITNGATLVFDRSSAWPIANGIAGTGVVVKVGAGIAAMTASNSWSGGLAINAGGVEALHRQALGAGPVVVTSNALLSAGSSTQPDAMTVEASALTLASARLPVDLGASGGEGGASNDLTRVAGGLSLSGTNILQFRFLQGGPATNIPYTIIRYGGALGGGATNLLPEPSRYAVTLDDAMPGEIRASFSGLPGSLTWRGDGGSNVWEIGGSTNWFNGVADDLFYQGDTVTFDDSGAGRSTVALQGVLTPVLVSVSSASNYTFSGSGSISGGTGLTKSGGGTLTIAGDHLYTGPTTVNGGVLALNDGNLLDRGTGTLTSTNVRVGPGAMLRLGATDQFGWGNAAVITVDGGQLVSVSNVYNYLKQVVLTNRASVVFGSGGYGGVYQCFGMGTLRSQASAAANVVSGGTIQAGQTFDVERGSAVPSDLTISTALADYGGAKGITKSGNGWLVLTGTNTYSGNTTINGGILKIGPGGVIYADAYRTPVVAVNAGAVLELNNWAYDQSSAHSMSLGGLSAGSGSIVVNGGTLRMSGTAPTAYTRGFTIGAGGATLDAGPGADWTLQWASQAPIVSSAGGALTLTGEGRGQFDKDIPGTGTLTKGGAGTWTLTGIGTYGGGTTVSLGTLSLGGGGTNGSVAGAIVDNSVLVLNRSDAWSMANVISGTGTVTKTGTGTVTLTAAGSWSGGSTINSGGVVVANPQALGTGAVLVNSNALLSIGAPYLSPGGRLNTGSLTLDACRLRLDLGGATTDGGGSSDAIQVSGGVTLAGTNTVQLDFVNGLPSTNGYYTLIRYSGTLSGGAGNLQLSQATRMTAALDDSAPGEIRVRFSGAGSNLTWRGDGGANQWDLSVSTNWVNGAGGDVFVQGDSVIFDDTGSSNTAVALIGSIAPVAVIVSNTLSYSLAGSGSVIGGTGLVKDGPGVLVISSDNTFTGASRVVSGTLQLGIGGNSGSVGGPIANDAALTINRSDYLTFTNSISGTGNVRKTGGSTMRIYGNNTYSGTTMIDASNGLELAGEPNLSPASDLVLNGTMDLWMYSGAVKSLSGYGTAFANDSVRTLTVGTNNGSGSFSGVLKNYSWSAAAVLALTKTGNGTQTLSGTNTYTGATTVNGGVLKIAGQIYQTGAFFGAYGTAYILLTGGGTLELTQFDYGVAKPLSQLRNNCSSILVNGGRIRVTGTESAYRSFSIGAQGATLEVGAGAKFTKVAGSAASESIVRNAGDGSLTLDGAGEGEMQDALGTYGTWGPSAGLIKAGSGTWTLAGTNAYAGGTTVSNGTLAVSTGTLGSGGVTVRGGAVLRLSNGTAIDDSAKLSLGYDGSLFGKVDLAAGVTETVDSLEVNGRPMPAGTYGATGSGADHVSDSLFSGTGQLVVLRGVNVLTGAVLQVR